MIRILGILLALATLSGHALGQSITATVPGDRLGWEADELNVVISLLETSQVRLEVYSPAFDPDDYRASLDGRPELGDERYDRGEGEVQAHFSLWRNDSVLLERSFGVAPHGTEVLFDGELAPGEYTLRSSFDGLGKNSFVYTLESEPAAAVYFGAGETMLFNIRGPELQDVLTVVVDEEHAPATFELYDGDGPSELGGRLTTPSGPIEIPISGDLEWSTIRLGQPGTYTFSFYQPEGAYQHSNTIGIRANARLRSTPTGLRFTRLAPVQVRIIDVDGVNLPGNYVIETEGELRTAVLTGLPDNYRLVDTQTEGGVVENPRRVNFGADGGVAIYVAERVPSHRSQLTVYARLLYPGHSSPYDLSYLLSETAYSLGEAGELTIDVTPGVYTFRLPRIPGAKVSGPNSVIVGEGDHVHAYFVVEPQVQLNLAVDVYTRWQDEQFVFTATGSTLYQEPLPGLLRLALPAGLEALGPTAVEGTLVAGEPLVLMVPAAGRLVGEHGVPATLEQWGLSDQVNVQVLAPAVVEPEPQPEPKPEPEPEPEPEVVDPEPEPEPEPVVEEPEPEPEPLPDFAVARRSTIHLDFQAGRVHRCELAPLAPGESATLGLTLRVTDLALYAEPRIRPSANPAGALEVYVSSVSLGASGETAELRLQVRNLSDQNVAGGSVLVPLPLGTEAVNDANCVDAAQAGETLLLGHTLPEGATYVAGSSTLNGATLSDPAVNGDTLIWQLPWSEAGTVAYDVRHEAALPALAEPQLTTVYAEREHSLVGSLSRDDLAMAQGDHAATLEEASADLSAAPITGVASQILLAPARLVADGRNPLLVDVLVLNDAGEPVGNGVLSVAANGELAGVDAAPLVSGHQVVLTDGRARVELAPTSTPYTLVLSVLAVTEDGDLLVSERLQVLGTRTGLYQGQVSVTASFATPFSASGYARGYLELPLGDEGTLQAAVDVGASADGIDLDRSLAQRPQDSGRFPLTAAGEEAAPTLASADGIGVLYTAPGLSLGYYDGRAAVPGVTGLPSLTGAHATVSLAEGFEVQGYAALVASGTRTRVFAGDGTRRYSLGESVRPGSESVNVVAGTTVTPLVRNRDYVLDAYLGAITLVNPLWPYDFDMNPVTLHVEYAPATEPRDTVHGGFGVRYRASGATSTLSLEVGAAYTGHTTIGASLAWQGGRLDASAAYQLELADDASLSGRAELGYALTPQDRLSLRHVTARNNTTSLTYLHRFDWAQQNALTLSAGLAHTWEQSLLAAIVGADLRTGDLTVGATHTQPFDPGAQASTRATVGYDLNQNLTAKASAEIVWGNDVISVVGLEQRLGSTELSLSYELPTAAGAGNRARFGVRAPFDLTRNLSLDLHAGHSQSFNDGRADTSGGAALRYRTDGFVATLGGEVAYSGSQFKVVLRSGASGQLGQDQNLSFDANYQVVPSLEGRFTVAYSLKRGPLNLLTYHRMINRPGASLLEGELAPTLNFANRLQLRPGLAYRVLLDDPEGSAYQGSLFAVYYLQPRLGEWNTTLGLGLGGHMLYMPGLDAMAYGLSAEAQARIVDEVWLAVGYTLGGFEGLTHESRGGLYLRLDLVTGGQF